MPDGLLLLYAISFVCILLLVEGCYYLIADARGGPRRNINRRLRMKASATDGAAVVSQLRRKPSSEGDSAADKLLQWAPFKQIETLLTRAGLLISTRKFLLWLGLGWGAAVAALAALGTVIPIPFAFLALAVTVVALVGPVIALKRLTARRLTKLGEQLPDAVDMLVRSVRAGHPISSSIELVAREMRDPIGTEFGLAFDEMTYGLDLENALENMANRIPVADMNYVVVAVKLQAVSGGNLAEVLANLARLVRERQRIRLQIMALSAEGRFSTKILSALPFGIISIISVLNPSYYGAVLQAPVLQYILGTAFTVLLACVALMRKIVNFKV